MDWMQATELARQMMDASYEDSPADEFAEWSGMADPNGYGAGFSDADPRAAAYSGGMSGAAGAGSSYETAGGSDIIVPGVGAVDIVVQAAGNPSMMLTAGQAIMAIVQLVSRNTSIQDAIRRQLGAVLRPKAPVNGSQVSPLAAQIMWDTLPKGFKKPIAYHLAGFNEPIGLSKDEQAVLLALIVADAMDGEVDPRKLLYNCGCKT